jgi:hypothetical protein
VEDLHGELREREWLNVKIINYDTVEREKKEIRGGRRHRPNRYR